MPVATVPDHGFASPDPLAVGVDGKVGTRNAPTILNVAYAGSFNWDGRSDSLEDQVVGPLTSDVEMGNANVGEVVDRISAIPEYVTLFQKAFPAKIEGPVTEKRLLEAIAQFERALIRGGTASIDFRRQEYTALSKEARSGMWIFESRGGCWRCHSGPTLSDNQFHNTGVSFGTEKRDEGRFNATEQAEHRFQFRTPTLRNVALTPPYMHDGSIKSLKEVVEFYNRGGSVKDPLLDSKMKPLGLNDEEVSYLVAFLEALNSEPLKISLPGIPSCRDPRASSLVRLAKQGFVRLRISATKFGVDWFNDQGRLELRFCDVNPYQAWMRRS